MVARTLPPDRLQRPRHNVCLVCRTVYRVSFLLRYLWNSSRLCSVSLAFRSDNRNCLLVEIYLEYHCQRNAWQWCQDSFDNGYYGSSPSDDPSGAAGGSEHILRGGGWLHAAYPCRSAVRRHDGPGPRGDDAGFRVSQVLADKLGERRSQRCRGALSGERGGETPPPGPTQLHLAALAAHPPLVVLDAIHPGPAARRAAGSSSPTRRPAARSSLPRTT